MEGSSQIFKKEVAQDLFYGVDSFNFETLEQRAQAIMARAKEEADAQIARAAAEVDKIRADIRGQEFEAARKEGYDQGYAEGTAKGEVDGKEQAYSQVYVELKKAVDETPKLLTSWMEELESHRKKLTEEAEKDLLALAFAVGERIARLKIEADPQVVQNTLREAVDLVLNRKTLDVMIAPEDADAIEEYLPTLKKTYSDIDILRVHKDEKITRGSVEVHTARGQVSIHVDELIDSIARYLLGMEPGQVLERVMEQFEADMSANLDLQNRTMNSDEIALQEAMQGEYAGNEEEAKEAGTRVFMEDSILEAAGVETVADADDPRDDKQKESGAMTRLFTSDLFEDPPEEEAAEPENAEAHDTALIEDTPHSGDTAKIDGDDDAMRHSTGSIAADILGDSSVRDVMVEEPSPDEPSTENLVDSMLGDIGEAPAEAALDAAPAESEEAPALDDALSQLDGLRDEAKMDGGSALDGGANPQADALLDSVLDDASDAAPLEAEAAPAEEEAPALDDALSQLDGLRDEAKMDGGSALDGGGNPKADALLDSVLGDTNEEAPAEAGGLDDALSQLDGLRGEAMMDGGSALDGGGNASAESLLDSALGELGGGGLDDALSELDGLSGGGDDDFGGGTGSALDGFFDQEEEVEDDKPFMEDSFLDDIMGS